MAGRDFPQATAARGNPRTAVSRFRILGFLGLLAAPGPLAAAEDPLASFMVQFACLDARGAPLPGRLPFEPGCERTRPLSAGEPLPYRKHDWPGIRDAAALPSGYQASDSLHGTLLGRPAILQTFDFGGGARAFSRFDAGDGGQAVQLQDGIAASPMTEDGTGGVQWFQSPDCRPGAPAPGWLFAALPLRETWQERVVRIGTTHTASGCPRGFAPSLTRWRTARTDLPWREAATGATGTVPIRVMVSEHFGGASIAGANHLERFWFAHGLGLTRWERWENPASSHLPGRERERMAAIITRSGRCPAIAFSQPPAPGWQMVDCRTWTNMVRAQPSAPLASLPWPSPELR